jgi:uncharacterized protein (DUF433 family)
VEWRDRIVIDPLICHGKPCVKGTRIWVSLVLDFLASGESFEDVLREYPQLERADVLAHVPWSRVVEERCTQHVGRSVDLLEFTSANRERLVL